MYAITGITGQVGSQLANLLLAARQPVRAIVRSSQKGESWKKRGCEVAVADLNDFTALTKAFTGAEALFILLPPNFDPQPGFPEARALAANFHEAIATARPGRIVYLSTVGAQATTENLLTQHTINEKALSSVAPPIAFLRAAWFMENTAWDVNPAREGRYASYLQPLDKAFPMVAIADIAKVAAELMQDHWKGRRIVELEGPRRVSPQEIASTFARLLNRDVALEAVPRHSWASTFTAQGMKNPLPRIKMLDGFNEGWIDFESGFKTSRKGSTSLETVLKSLIDAKVQ